MEKYYPSTWLKFRKSEKRKNKKLKFVASNVPKLLSFKTTDLYIVYLFSEYVGN